MKLQDFDQNPKRTLAVRARSRTFMEMTFVAIPPFGGLRKFL